MYYRANIKLNKIPITVLSKSLIDGIQAKQSIRARGDMWNPRKFTDERWGRIHWNAQVKYDKANNIPFMRSVSWHGHGLKIVSNPVVKFQKIFTIDSTTATTMRQSSFRLRRLILQYWIRGLIRIGSTWSRSNWIVCTPWFYITLLRRNSTLSSSSYCPDEEVHRHSDHRHLYPKCPRTTYTARPCSSLLRHIFCWVTMHRFGALFVGLIVASTWACPRILDHSFKLTLHRLHGGTLLLNDFHQFSPITWNQFPLSRRGITTHIKTILGS